VFRELAEAPVNYASSTGPIRGGSGGRVRPYRGAARENELSKNATTGGRSTDLHGP
jgi:hypothetical protein